MLIKDVKKMDLYEILFYWIRERENIRQQKESDQPPPWTDDEILAGYRFCNVRRMDDKVSRWLLENWYKPNFNDGNMLPACAVARFFNLPSSLKAIGFPRVWDPEKMKAILRSLQKKEAIFNGAYMVRGNDGMNKIECVLDYYVQPLVNNPPEIDPSSMENSWKALLPYYGYGSFMAGQVITDLRWGRSGSWRDKDSWAAIGPGSARGMNRLQNRPLNYSLKQEVFQDELLELIDTCKERLPAKIIDRLEAIDYQNCLCEYDKYLRCLLDARRPKQRYQAK